MALMKSLEGKQVEDFPYISFPELTSYRHLLEKETWRDLLRLYV
jgi:hypothetical protein